MKNIKIFNVILYIGIFLGLMLRIVFFINQSNIMNDSGRDLLMARQITSYHQYPAIGPITYFSDFKLSPYYFYFLALLVSIFDNAFFVYFFTLCLSLVSIRFFYLGIKNLFDQETAEISICIFLLSLNSIETVNFWSCFVIQSFFFLALYLFSLFYKSKRTIFLYLSIPIFSFICVSSLEFAYIIPIVIIWSLYLIRIFDKSSLIKAIFAWIVLLGIGFLPIFLYYKLGLLEIIRNRIFSHTFTIYTFFNNLVENTKTLFYYLFPENRLISIFILIAFFLIKLVKNKIKINELFFLLLFCWGIFLSGFIKNLLSYHFLAFLPIFFVIISNDLSILTKKSILLFVILIIIFVNLQFDKIRNLFVYNNILIRTKLVAEEINKQIRIGLLKESEFKIVSFPSDGPYQGLQYYFFLLKKEKPYLNISNEEPFNFKYIDTNKIIFLICEDYQENAWDNNRCIYKYFKLKKIKLKKWSIFYANNNIIGYKITTK